MTIICGPCSASHPLRTIQWVNLDRRRIQLMSLNKWDEVRKIGSEKWRELG